MKKTFTLGGIKYTSQKSTKTPEQTFNILKTYIDEINNLEINVENIEIIINNSISFINEFFESDLHKETDGHKDLKNKNIKQYLWKYPLDCILVPYKNAILKTFDMIKYIANTNSVKLSNYNRFIKYFIKLCNDFINGNNDELQLIMKDAIINPDSKDIKYNIKKYNNEFYMVTVINKQQKDLYINFIDSKLKNSETLSEKYKNELIDHLQDLQDATNYFYEIEKELL